MEVVLNLGAPVRRFHENEGSTWTEDQPSRMLVGQMDHHVTVHAAGRVDVVGVRFHPTGAHSFFRFPLAEIANELVALEDLVGLHDELGSDSSTEKRTEALNRHLAPRFADAAAPDPDFERAVSSVVRAEGRISVDALAAGMGVGPRQLERRFRERVGLGPKRFAKVLRFQSVFRRAALDERRWAALSLDCGYYDQSHFIRDFKSFTGRSPAALFSNESELTRVFTRRRRLSGSYNTRP
jgi:AraC-like DNA-binding protein